MTERLSGLTWVFAHGSLMFDPGFVPAAVMPGRAWGWERRFGQPSVRNWGIAEAPAPTCSLSPGGHCDGLLLGLPGGSEGSVLDPIRRREANEPITLSVTSEFGDVSAFTWLMSDAWAALSVTELVDHGMANVEAGGGPSGDAWQYAAGVRDALAARKLDDPLVDGYVRAFEPAVQQVAPPRRPEGEALSPPS